LNVLFASQQGKMRAGIKNFLATERTDVEFYANRFQELLDLLEPNNGKLEGAGQSKLHARHLKPPDEFVYPDSIRDDLITAMRKHAACISSMHVSKAPMDMNYRHLTRLCLSTEGRT
jgi:hypothetical protein